MTGSVSDIDLSVANIWNSWFNFRRGKRSSRAIVTFEYYLESNLSRLQQDLVTGNYRHGGYEHFVVHDNKPRAIAVAAVRDRVIHRLLYDYLVPIWDKTFIYDAWSCRQGKGLHQAVDRAQSFMRRYPEAWVWRADIKKMFDSIDQDVMKRLLRRRLNDVKALALLDEVIDSYALAEGKGIPIGNLTSQIMSNIYLNEFDRLVQHQLKPLAYLRYGDDWLCFARDRHEITTIQHQSRELLNDGLLLTVNPKLDRISPVHRGVSYLGVDIWSHGRRLQCRMRTRVLERVNASNISSYRALLAAHEKPKKVKYLDWQLL